MIAAIPVHNIYRLCYANEAEDSHVIAIQSGNYKEILWYIYSWFDGEFNFFTKIIADNHENCDNFDVYLTIVNTKVNSVL